MGLRTFCLVAGIFVAACGSTTPGGDVPGVQAAFGDSSELVVSPAVLADRAAWSPDGMHLVLLVDRIGGDGGLLRANGGEWVALTDPELAVADFAWMSDSQRLIVAYYDSQTPAERSGVVNTRLGVVDLDGDLIEELPLSEELRIEYGMVVGQSGQLLVAGGGSPSRADRDFDPQLIEVDLEDGAVTRLANPPGAAVGWPQANGDTVVAFSNALSGGNWDDELVVVDPLSDVFHRVPIPEGVVPQAFGLTNDSVLYRGYVESGEAAVYESALDGSSQRTLAVDDAIHDIAIHPEGTVAVVRRYDPNRGGFPGSVWYEPLDVSR